MMKTIGGILLKGLVTILPIGLTVYFVYWLGVTTEALLSKPIKLVIDDAHYWPGMGLVTGFLLLFLIGLGVNAFVVRRILGYGEELLLRVPVVKTVYSAIRDMTRLVNTDKKKGDLDRVVTLDIGYGRLIGFVTQEHANTLGIGGGEDLVAVYLPMSYMIGGYTIYLPRSRLTETDLSVEQAMRIVLTGGVRGPPGKLATSIDVARNHSAGLLDVGVAQLPEFFDQPVAVIALDFDDAVLHRATGATLLLERTADFFELRSGQWNAVNRAHALAATMRGFLPDADGRWLARRTRSHDLPSLIFDASASSCSHRSMLLAIRVSSSVTRSRSTRICSAPTR